MALSEKSGKYSSDRLLMDGIIPHVFIRFHLADWADMPIFDLMTSSNRFAAASRSSGVTWLSKGKIFDNSNLAVQKQQYAKMLS